MEKRLLVTGAGSGESNNLIRSLREGDPLLFILGCHSDRFILKKSLADRNYLLPPSTHRDFADALRRVVEREQVDLVIPTSDADVKTLSQLRDGLPGRLFLPRAATIELCQDKYGLTAFLRSRGLPAPLTFPVMGLDSIEEIFRRLTPHSRLWCRIRTGSGSMGAIPVTSPDQARSWVSYWEKMRGVPATSFTLSEYLPGRDFACQSLWQQGRLIVVKTCERLSYYGGWNRASGVSSTPALAASVFEPQVARVCAEAIRAVDQAASGVFSVDLKQDANGVPCVTEINAGRFFMITNLFDLTGKHNTAVLYVRLAVGEPVEFQNEYDVAEDYYLVRDLDTLPGIFHADELFESINEATA